MGKEGGKIQYALHCEFKTILLEGILNCLHPSNKSRTYFAHNTLGNVLCGI